MRGHFNFKIIEIIPERSRSLDLQHISPWFAVEPRVSRGDDSAGDPSVIPVSYGVNSPNTANFPCRTAVACDC